MNEEKKISIEMQEQIEKLTPHLEKMMRGEFEVSVVEDNDSYRFTIKGIPLILTDKQKEGLKVYINTSYILNGKEEEGTGGQGD